MSSPRRSRIFGGRALTPTRSPPAALHPTINGHAIEVRLCAEDPAAGYLPQSGRVVGFDIPALANVRVDTGLLSGDDIPPYYDSMIGKLIVHRPTRAAAIATMLRALDEFVIEGVKTTIPLAKRMLRDPNFVAGTVHTKYVEQTLLAK